VTLPSAIRRDLTHAPGDDEVERCSQQLRFSESLLGFDPFGLSRDSLVPALRVARWFYRHYFRVHAVGLDNIPGSGRVLLVGNHSGRLPYDAVMIICALLLEGTPPRLARSMVEQFVPRYPFLSYLLARWGQVLGTPANCRWLLEHEEAVLVFPEGVRGISKPMKHRYQLEPFGHGFVTLALETGTPIIPIAVIGAEEQAPAFNVKVLARAFGVPAFPFIPVPPFVPVIPFPVKYRLYFGEPLRLCGDPEDETEVERNVQVVRGHIETLIAHGLRERKHVFW
jgi:1-acyl-sn-glycerol-3-phosphate acyltransferase